MNLTISGHHLEVTPALREYVLTKLDRVTRHFDQVVGVAVTLTYYKHEDKDHRHMVEIDLHMKNRDVHVEYTNGDMCATVDAAMDKLDRQVVRHKDKLQNHRHVSPKRDFAHA